ncbi:MAG: acyltransferase [Gemmatimonadales bacterium]
MVLRPLRTIALPETSERVYTRWLGEMEERLQDPQCDRYTLYAIFYPGAPPYEDVLADSATHPTTRAALLALDPHNITLEPEYYREIDVEKYARVKPLLWLWQCFDRSVMGGGNVDLGVRLRRILAPHVFKRCGKNFKCFQFVEFSFGYNMEVGDDVVVHRHVLLDDRGGIILGDKVSIADYANIYSHTHDIVEQADVTDAVTILEDGARITYHATVLAGVRVGENSIVGANAVASRDVKPWHVYLGIPAKPVRVKPNAPPEVREQQD